MNVRSVRWGRLAALATAVGLAVALVALPAAAFAATKATTRIVVAKSVTVDNDDPNVDPWPIGLSVKLQKKSGSRYVALKGTVKLYWSGDGTHYSPVDSKKASSMSFPLDTHGKLKLAYGGSSTTKACIAYSSIYEMIGDTVADPVITIAPIAGTTASTVTVTYDVAWNTNAYDGPVMVAYMGWFRNDDTDDPYAAYIEQYREIWAPGTVEFDYKVENEDLLNRLDTDGGPFVSDDYDPYVVTPSEVAYDYPLS